MIRKSLITHVLWALTLFTPGVQASDNTVLGTGAGGSLAAGAHYNTFIGVSAGNAVTTGEGNTFVGDYAGWKNTLNNNTFFGRSAGFSNTTGTVNTFIGESAGHNNSAGSYNTFVGRGAGYNATGSRNVIVGYQAGFDETGSNKLYIDSTTTTAPLIYGEFDNNIVGINGKLGVGTQSPAELVEAVADSAAARFQLTSYSSSASQAPQYIMRRANGTLAAPTALGGYNNLGQFSFRGYNGSAMTGSRAVITVQTTQAWTGGANGTRLLFQVTPNGSTAVQQVLVINGSGNVDVPNGDLSVGGTTLNVPDYVFEDNYQLMPLADLKAYVEKNKHLPKVASAQDIKRGGLKMGQSQMALLEKIEELTLYTLQQHARAEKQNKQIVRLQAESAALKREKDGQITRLTQSIKQLEKWMVSEQLSRGY